VKLDPGAHVFYAFGFALKSGCDNFQAIANQRSRKKLISCLKGPERIVEDQGEMLKIAR
jgi:hypothetical protein